MRQHPSIIEVEDDVIEDVVELIHQNQNNLTQNAKRVLMLDQEEPEPDGAQPTKTLPCTYERLEVYRERAAKGLQIFNSDDAVMDENGFKDSSQLRRQGMGPCSRIDVEREVRVIKTTRRNASRSYLKED